MYTAKYTLTIYGNKAIDPINLQFKIQVLTREPPIVRIKRR